MRTRMSYTEQKKYNATMEKLAKAAMTPEQARTTKRREAEYKQHVEACRIRANAERRRDALAALATAEATIAAAFRKQIAKAQAVVDEFADVLKKTPSYAFRRDGAEAIEAATKIDVYTGYAEWLERVAADPTSTKYGLDEFVKQIERDGRNVAASDCYRSTSAVANLQADAERRVKADLAFGDSAFGAPHIEAFYCRILTFAKAALALRSGDVAAALLALHVSNADEVAQ